MRKTIHVHILKTTLDLWDYKIKIWKNERNCLQFVEIASSYRSSVLSSPLSRFTPNWFLRIHIKNVECVLRTFFFIYIL